MSNRALWWVAKVLEGTGLVVVLVGVSLSVGLGLDEEGLASMVMEMKGLALGGMLFLAGYLLERRLGPS
jgi:hypothetical protein